MPLVTALTTVILIHCIVYN